MGPVLVEDDGRQPREEEKKVEIPEGQDEHDNAPE